MMCELLAPQFPHVGAHKPDYADFRKGDVRHSQADISKAEKLLGFAPTHRIGEGMQEAMAWYVRNLTQNN
jgi:UDP-N-acetylglucosamine/UDP-N-acetylgalactosamine 4-epimerase